MQNEAYWSKEACKTKKEKEKITLRFLTRAIETTTDFFFFNNEKATIDRDANNKLKVS